MNRFLDIYKVHAVAWAKLMGTLFIFAFSTWLIGSAMNIIFNSSVDTARALRLSLWFILLGLGLPFITAKFFPNAFD